MVACTTRAMPINMQFSSVFQDLNFVLRGSSANPSRPHQTSHDPFPLRTSPVGRAECMNFPQRKDTGPPGRCIELIVWLDVIPIDHHEVPGQTWANCLQQTDQEYSGILQVLHRFRGYAVVCIRIIGFDCRSEFRWSAKALDKARPDFPRIEIKTSRVNRNCIISGFHHVPSPPLLLGISASADLGPENMRHAPTAKTPKGHLQV